MHPLMRMALQPLKHSVLIKGLLYRCIWLLPERFRSQSLIRCALKRFADRKGQDVTFVNIGANDGLSGDHLREFIIRKRWRGLLVEPVPFVFDRLRRAYRGVDTVQFEQAAIAAQDGTTPFWFLQKNNTLAPGYDQIGSFSRDYLLHHAGMFPGLEPFITSMAVPSLTLASLLRKHAMSQLDILFIDAEGYDGKIVKQIDFRQPPGLVIFENARMPAAEREECHQLLACQGYRIADDGSNTIATHAQKAR